MRGVVVVGVGLVLALLPGCDVARERALRERESYVLNRIGYGADPWSAERIRSLGIRGYIDEQLEPHRLDDSELEHRISARYPSLGLSLATLRARYAPGRDPGPAQPRNELVRAQVWRAIYSKRQLEQVLVDFWFDHFNVNARSGDVRWAVVPFERDAIRPHVLGRFEDLLMATATHPAMLAYLDNEQNFRAGFRLDGIRQGPNENYARELLELHTVGLEAGFTLEDVHDAARALSGWTVDERKSGFRFLPEGHDQGPKQILGLSLQSGGGFNDGVLLLRYLARHPMTATRVAAKLCRHLVADDAPAGCVARAAHRFLATDGDLREVVRAVLTSEEFLNLHGNRTKVKRPLHYVASIARALGLESNGTYVEAAVASMSRMGEDPYYVIPPSGRSKDPLAWSGQGAFIERMNFAHFAANGRNGVRAPKRLTAESPLDVVLELEQRVTHGMLGLPTWAVLAEFLPSVPSSPTNLRATEATMLVLAGPGFVLY